MQDVFISSIFIVNLFNKHETRRAPVRPKGLTMRRFLLLLSIDCCVVKICNQNLKLMVILRELQ